jgi:hypothetical protein
MPVFPGDSLKEVKTLTGTVMLYNRLLMRGTSQGDIILRLNGTNQFVRLVYSPFDFGFDAPDASESQLMPREMIADGTQVWAFKAHLPWNGEERGACTPLPKEVKGPDGKPLPIDRNVYSLPGQEGTKLPPIENLQCFVVTSWAKGIEGDNSGTAESKKPAAN